MSPDATTYNIGGLQTHIYGLSTLSSGASVTVLFLLHGRLHDHTSFAPFVAAFDLPTLNARKDAKRQLLICTFDQRNHGHRLVDNKANLTWMEGNGTHAQDMYSVIAGTAHDVSMLIDYLPSYLFPSGEHQVVDWGVAGVSLGGHAVWLCLEKDDRIQWGCSFIGCPSYIELMEYRLNQQKLPNEQKYLPKTFLRVLERDDPGTILRQTGTIPEALRKKPIFVLAGQEDKLVPWTACETFMQKLREENSRLMVVRYDGVGHEVNHPDMLAEFKSWTLQFLPPPLPSPTTTNSLESKLGSVKI